MPQEDQQTPPILKSTDGSNSTNSYHVNYGSSNHPNRNGRGEGQPTCGRTKRAERQCPGQSLEWGIRWTQGFLNCSTSTTWRRAKEPNCLYHNIQKINIPFTVCVKWSMVKKALLDSSVMDNFINHQTTKCLGIHMEPLKQPI